MLKSDNTPVIIDFGLSTFVHKDTHIYTKCGTPGYLSPEIVFLNAENPQFYTQSDIFSVGVIFHYLITGMPLFNGETASEVYERNKKLCSHNCKNVRSSRLNLLGLTTSYFGCVRLIFKMKHMRPNREDKR